MLENFSPVNFRSLLLRTRWGKSLLLQAKKLSDLPEDWEEEFCMSNDSNAILFFILCEILSNLTFGWYRPPSGNRALNTVEDTNTTRSVKLDASAQSQIEKHRYCGYYFHCLWSLPKMEFLQNKMQPMWSDILTVIFSKLYNDILVVLFEWAYILWFATWKNIRFTE